MEESTKFEELNPVKARLNMIINHSGKAKTRFFEDMGIAFNTGRNWTYEGKGIGAELFILMPIYYPQYNVLWLITGEGEMILENQDLDSGNVNEDQPEYGKSENSKLKDKLIRIQEEYLQCLKEKNRLITMMAQSGTLGTVS